MSAPDGLTPSCTCGTPGLDYEGPVEGCEWHGELRAVLVGQRNEARDALAALRSRIEALHSPMQTSAGDGGIMCAACRRPPRWLDEVTYPCSTVLALRDKP